MYLCQHRSGAHKVPPLFPTARGITPPKVSQCSKVKHAFPWRARRGQQKALFSLWKGES